MSEKKAKGPKENVEEEQAPQPREIYDALTGSRLYREMIANCTDEDREISIKIVEDMANSYDKIANIIRDHVLSEETSEKDIEKLLEMLQYKI